MAYQISGLREALLPLFSLDDRELRPAGALRVIADAPHAFPCSEFYAPDGRDAISCGACHLRSRVGGPAALARRLLAVRAFDSDGMMIDADVIAGTDLHTLVNRLLASQAASYLHVHYAKRVCYAARIDRA